MLHQAVLEVWWTRDGPLSAGHSIGAHTPPPTAPGAWEETFPSPASTDQEGDPWPQPPLCSSSGAVVLLVCVAIWCSRSLLSSATKHLGFGSVNSSHVGGNSLPRGGESLRKVSWP